MLLYNCLKIPVLIFFFQVVWSNPIEEDEELTEVEKDDASNALYNVNLTEGDLIGHPDWSKLYGWPKGDVPVRLAGNFGGAEILQIEEVLQIFESKCCVRFRATEENDTASIFFTHGNDSRCGTHLGRQGGVQEIELGRPNCWTKGNLMHLMMHALGLPHEHTRSDRHEVLRVTYRNVIPEAATYFVKHPGQSTQYYPYDYYSIMHFSRKAFSKNGKPTLYPRFIIRGRNSRHALGQRLKLSPYDVIKLNHIYPCPKETKKELEMKDIIKKSESS